MRSEAKEIDENGFRIVPEIFERTEVEGLGEVLETATSAGRRGLLGIPEVTEFATSARLMELVRPHASSQALPVRAIYFDKCAAVNWLVTWHQDLTIAVESKVELAGFGPWSIKEGITHVQPPVELLEQMLAVRVHLDDCDETNGALRVLPGTHRLGRLSSERIQALRAEKDEVVCRASAGDVMLMRPLLLHASGKSKGEGHRRVLHIEYAGFELPERLRWHRTG